MYSYEEIFNSLENIRSQYDLTGDSLEILNRLLARSIYENQVEEVIDVLESSLFRARNINNSIDRAYKSGYSVFRGKNQRIKIKKATALTDINIKKFDKIATIDNFDLIAAHDIYFNKKSEDGSYTPNILDFEVIVCNRNEVFDVEADLVKNQILVKLDDSDVSNDCAVYITRDGVETEWNITDNYKNRFDPQESVPWVQVMTNSNYSVNIINTHQDVESPAQRVGLNFESGDKLRFRYIKYTPNELDVSKIKFITGFDRNSYTEFISIPHESREQDLLKIYLNTLKNHEKSIYQLTTEELHDVFSTQYSDLVDYSIVVKDNYEKSGLLLETPDGLCLYRIKGVLYKYLDSGNLELFENYDDITLLDLDYFDSDKQEYVPFTSRYIVSTKKQRFNCFIKNRLYGKITDQLGTYYIESGRYKLYLITSYIKLDGLLSEDWDKFTRGPLNYNSCFIASTESLNYDWELIDLSRIDRYQLQGDTGNQSKEGWNPGPNKGADWTLSVRVSDSGDVTSTSGNIDFLMPGGNDLRGKPNSDWDLYVKFFNGDPSSGGTLIKDFGCVAQSHSMPKRDPNSYHRTWNFDMSFGSPVDLYIQTRVTAGNDKPQRVLIIYRGKTDIKTDDIVFNYENIGDSNSYKLDKSKFKYINKLRSNGLEIHKDDFYYAGVKLPDRSCLNQLVYIPPEQYNNRNLSDYGKTWIINCPYETITTEITPSNVGISEYPVSSDGYITEGIWNGRPYQIITFDVTKDYLGNNISIGTKLNISLNIHNSDNTIKYVVNRNKCIIKRPEGGFTHSECYYTFVSSKSDVYGKEEYIVTLDTTKVSGKTYYYYDSNNVRHELPEDDEFDPDIDYYEKTRTYIGVDDIVGKNNWTEVSYNNMLISRSINKLGDYLVFLIPQYDLSSSEPLSSELTFSYAKKISFDVSMIDNIATETTRLPGRLYYEKIESKLSIPASKSFTWNDGDCQADISKTINLETTWIINSLRVSIKAQGRNDEKSVISWIKAGTSSGSQNIFYRDYTDTYAENDTYTQLETFTVSGPWTTNSIYLSEHNKGGDRFEITLSNFDGIISDGSYYYKLYTGDSVKGKYYLDFISGVNPCRYSELGNGLGEVALHHLKVTKENKSNVFQLTNKLYDTNCDQDQIDENRNGALSIVTSNCILDILYLLDEYTEYRVYLLDYNTKNLIYEDYTSLSVGQYLNLLLKYRTPYLRWIDVDDSSWTIDFSGFLDYPRLMESIIDIYYHCKLDKLPLIGKYSESWFNYYLQWNYDREVHINLIEKTEEVRVYSPLTINYKGSSEDIQNSVINCVNKYIINNPNIFDIYKLMTEIGKLDNVISVNCNKPENYVFVIEDNEYINFDLSTTKYRLFT